MFNQFGWQAFAIRFLFAFIIVAISWNPEGWSFTHWAILDFEFEPKRIVAGIILTIGWVIYIRATLRSLGHIGLLLVGGLCASLVWLFVDLGWIAKESPRTISYVAIFIITLILSVGMSWSHIRRRMSGQYDMDDVQEED